MSQELETSTEVNLKKRPDVKFKRKLTPFLCRELLYEYAMSRLDSARKAAIEEMIESDSDCRASYQKVKAGIHYSSQLADTSIPTEILTQLMDAENALSLGRRYSTWRSWPDTVRWSLTAIATSIVVATTIALVPWEKLRTTRPQASNEIELAEIPNFPSEHSSDVSGEESQSGILAGSPGAPDAVVEQNKFDGAVADGEETPIAVSPSRLPEQGARLDLANAHDVIDSSGDTAHEPQDVARPSSSSRTSQVGGLVAPAAPLQPGGPATSEAAGNSVKSADAKPKGFVYRAFMNLSDLDVLGPKIADVIRGLGGERAGEVELGWQRGTGRYYHFALPEINEKKVIEQLQVYGPVRISKDPHPRVMPQGQIRFILWVESVN
jgi:hypothetical protein